MWFKSVIDSVLNANGITSIWLVLMVIANSMHAVECADLNTPGNDLIANVTAAAPSLNATENATGIRSPKVLSRRKRYVAFPEGSSFSVGLHFIYLHNCSRSSIRWTGRPIPHSFHSNIT